MRKRWPFTLAYYILALPGIILYIWGPDYGISKYVGWSVMPLAFAIMLFTQRAPKRRWLVVSMFFVLEEIGFLLPAFWQVDIAFWVSVISLIAAFMAAIFIPPRMPLWPKKETPQAQT